MKLLRLPVIATILFLSIATFAQTETERGVELYRNGDCNAAITVLENVVKADDQDRKAWLYLGVCLGKKEKNDDAAKAFRKWRSIKTSPTTVAKDDSIEGVKILSKPQIRTTEESRRNNIAGSVILLVEFMENGKIGYIFALQTLPNGLTDNSIYAARQIKFKPAQKDGKSISVIKFIEYNVY